MNIKYSHVVTFLLILFIGLDKPLAQTVPFRISLEPVEVSGLGGIQSYAFAQAEGKWLIIGGRLDGLHLRQPFASFDISGNNNQLIVVDPISKEVWTSSLVALPIDMQEQLSSTNMEFYQDGDYLYFLGGYGYNQTANDHVTYDNLIAIDVAEVISNVINGEDFSQWFRQISDPLFQVTGGRLRKINNNYYLLGGQKFTGRYNPMGPNSGPGFVQEYTNAIRVFEIDDDGTEISINHLEAYINSENLHRRDYNAEPQIFPDGTQGITMFSGVFQPDADLPFLNSIDVSADNYTVNDSFQQLFNHYHCPVIPLYSNSENTMYNLFFGGIAQYYQNGGILVQDDNVPFVKTIAAVIRDKSGKMTERILPVEMPELLGAGAEFIPNLDLPHYSNGVINIDEQNEEEFLLGYIFGGISSTALNIFFSNDGSQSKATNQIFKVILNRNLTLGNEVKNVNINNDFNLITYPNPTRGDINIKFNLSYPETVQIKIYDIYLRLLEKRVFKNLQRGENVIPVSLNSYIENSSTYFIKVETEDRSKMVRIILN